MRLCLNRTKCRFGSGIHHHTGDSDLPCYLLHGRKAFIHNGPICDYALVLARSQEGSSGHQGLSIFVVDSSLPRFSRGKKENKMGQRHSVDQLTLRRFSSYLIKKASNAGMTNRVNTVETANPPSRTDPIPR
jgi:alkylation response protein AidB-like acyl-CoA dehydrogenase